MLGIVLVAVVIGSIALLIQRGGAPAIQTTTGFQTYTQPRGQTITSPITEVTTTTRTTVIATQTAIQATQPQGNVVLRVLSRHPTDILEKARIAFLQSELARRYGVIDVRTIVIDASAWPDFVRRGNADVLCGGGPTLFDTLYINGLLAPLDSEPVLSVMRDIPDTVVVIL